jgi:hypothetical protein
LWIFAVNSLTPGLKDNIMTSKFLPFVNLDKINAAVASGDGDLLFSLLAEPLHEELYRRNTFDFLDELSAGQQLLVAYDYLRMQAGQGGFIQFIENGYVGLLPSMVEQLIGIGEHSMSKTLDDVLKVYVLNRDIFIESSTLEDFAKLYDELKEFEELDQRFSEQNLATVKFILAYAVSHLEEFISTELLN